jgi:hypothetical protein
MHQIVRSSQRDGNSSAPFFAHTAESGMNFPTVIEQPDRLSSSSAQAASERRTGLMTDAERESLITFHGEQ